MASSPIPVSRHAGGCDRGLPAASCLPSARLTRLAPPRTRTVPGQLVSILLPLAPITYHSAPNALTPCPRAVPAAASAVK
jgi:hypothetical protein